MQITHQYVLSLSSYNVELTRTIGGHLKIGSRSLNDTKNGKLFWSSYSDIKHVSGACGIYCCARDW